MKKVLLIQGIIPNYRVPIFNALAKKVDLTVVYSAGPIPDDVEFKTMCIPTCKFRWHIHTKNIYRLAQKFDVVICMLDLSYLYFHLLNVLPHKYKLIYWGIGVSAGYATRYDQDERTAIQLSKAIRKADAAVFYSSYPVSKYSQMKIPPNKLFVANNTVQVLQGKKCKKDCLLFVGSLYKAKKIFELLSCYYNASKVNSKLPKLIIVGDGDDAQAIKEWVKSHNFEKEIVLTGAIYDEKTLSEYFSRAIVCFSPDQAGLSVLKSFGYGVPFVTHKNAITGGERLNIISGENGILLESFEEMKDIIIDCSEHPDKYIEMGKSAKKFYDENRTVNHMVSGFLDAIDYVCAQ